MNDMPGQTIEDHEKDMQIIKDMGYSEDNIYRSYQLSRCAPFPGTKLYEQVKEQIGEEKMKEYNLKENQLKEFIKNNPKQYILSSI